MYTKVYLDLSLLWCYRYNICVQSVCMLNYDGYTQLGRAKPKFVCSFSLVIVEF